MSLPANWSSRLLLTALSFMLPEAPLLGQKIRRIGAEVYAKNCASIYCHGAQGTAGAAPAVAGKGLSLEQLNPIVREGVPDTAMAGWKDVLSASDLAAVIEYVSSIQETLRSRREELDPNRPWLTHAGRELFFDPNRITPCGSCHDFDGLGLAVAPHFKAAPSPSAAALRTLKSDKVRTIRPRAQEPFVGIAAPSKGGVQRWYDLSAKLPVLRTFGRFPEPSEPASSWSHGDVISAYSDAELERVLEFAREALAAPAQ